MQSQSTFDARISHEQTQIHKTHHDPDLKEATTFPLLYSLCLAIGPTPKCHFVLGFPSGGPEISKIGIPTTLEAHNFVCRPLIEVRS
jgi:hypothetical protein